MKTFVSAMLILCCVVSISIAQPKVVHFKKLQEFLPAKEISGFKRNKPIGSTQSAMGMTTSEASVRFVKPAADENSSEQTIEIKITDMILIPYAAWAMSMNQSEYENETEDGYEKSVTIKEKYKGIEKASTGDYKSCSLDFVTGTRFHVEIQANGFADAKMLMTLVESMNLTKLEQLQSEK